MMMMMMMMVMMMVVAEDDDDGALNPMPCSVAVGVASELRMRLSGATSSDRGSKWGFPKIGDPSIAP